MILAGAIGNVFDSIFYGVIFSDSTPIHVATLFPPEGGYGTWLHGKVVDMFYFPLFEFNWPAWMPWIGGQEFVFFRYIFNLADAALSVGVVLLLLFYRNTSFAAIEK
jgi:signal peptidase II